MCFAPRLPHQPRQLRWQRTAAQQPPDFHRRDVGPGTTHVLLKASTERPKLPKVGRSKRRNFTELHSTSLSAWLKG